MGWRAERGIRPRRRLGGADEAADDVRGELAAAAEAMAFTSACAWACACAATCACAWAIAAATFHCCTAAAAAAASAAAAAAAATVAGCRLGARGAPCWATPGTTPGGDTPGVGLPLGPGAGSSGIGRWGELGGTVRSLGTLALSTVRPVAVGDRDLAPEPVGAWLARPASACSESGAFPPSTPPLVASAAGANAEPPRGRFLPVTEQPRKAGPGWSALWLLLPEKTRTATRHHDTPFQLHLRPLERTRRGPPTTKRPWLSITGVKPGQGYGSRRAFSLWQGQVGVPAGLGLSGWP